MDRKGGDFRSRSRALSAFEWRVRVHKSAPDLALICHYETLLPAEQWCTAMASFDEVATRVRAIIVKELDVRPEQVTPETSLSGDLGIDSLDIVTVVLALEGEFGIEFQAEEVDLFRTVGDLIRYIQKRVA